MRHILRGSAAVAAATVLAACGIGGFAGSSAPVAAPPGAAPATFEGPVAKASCGPNDAVETGLQGQVPQSDRVSRRSLEGYNCNLERVGHFDNNGEGAGWQHAWYEDCAYMGLAIGSARDGERVPRPGQRNSGVAVIDVANPLAPVASTYLPTISMADPWESLKVNERRQLLGAVNSALGGSITSNGGREIDLYDISGDCRQPQLLASVAVGESSGHAGHFAPDGLTYWGSPITDGILKPIDISDPANPTLIWEEFPAGTHDLSISQDGTRAYLANNSGNGLTILDVTDVQNRVPNPQSTIVSELYWTDGSTAQMTQRMTIGGKPYLLFVDELGQGAARIIDITNEAEPFIASKLKLEVQMPENDEAIAPDQGSAPFGYDGHYCTASDGKTDHTTYDVENAAIAVCSYFDSGLRVFDIRDVYRPREIAYWIAPTLPGPRVSSYYNLDGVCGAVDWASAHPRFVPSRNEIWVTTQCNGFHVLRLTRPLAELLGPTP
jgi:hypothetical protein